MNILNIETWNKKVITLTESQVSRLITKHSKDGFFVISACRSNNTEKENQIKTNELKQDLKNEGLTYTVVYGGGFQEKGTEQKELGEPKINETSFLVYNYKRDKNSGNVGKLERDDLFNIALKLCKKYNQDDVMFQEPNGKSYWYDRNGKVDASFEKNLKVNDRTQQFFTSFGKNIEGSNNTPNKDGKMSKANADRFSGVMEGIYFNPPASTEIGRQKRIRIENEVFVDTDVFTEEEIRNLSNINYFNY